MVRLTQLSAQVHLERALEQKVGEGEADAGADVAVPIAADSSLAQLDPALFHAISSIPLDWRADAPPTELAALAPVPVGESTATAAPGADAATAIAIESDEDEPAGPQNVRRSGEDDVAPAKRRKLDYEVPVASADDFMTMLFPRPDQGTQGADPLLGDHDMPWLDFGSLGRQDGGVPDTFAGLFTEGSSVPDLPDPNAAGKHG